MKSDLNLLQSMTTPSTSRHVTFDVVTSHHALGRCIVRRVDAVGHVILNIFLRLRLGKHQKFILNLNSKLLSLLKLMSSNLHSNCV
jgi:hypothetical protein